MRTVVGALVGCVVLTLVLAACASPEDETVAAPTADLGDTELGAEPDPVAETETDAEPAPVAEGDEGATASGEPIVIGGTLGLTGAFSGPAAGYEAAYDYWLEEVNANGGLLGRPVEMITYDDESTPAVAQQLYQRLINEDGVDLLLAPYTTFIGGAILPIVEQNEMLLWNGGFVGIDLFTQSDWIVGAYTYQEPDYPRGVFEVIDELPEDQRPQRVGIATAQNPFTILVRDGFEGEGGVRNFAEERGMEVVVDEEYAPDVTDVSGIIQQAKDADVDLFFALSLPNDAALLARTAQDQGFEPTMYCSCGSQVTTLPFWPDLGAAGDGIVATAMAWPTDDHPGLDGLFTHFQETLGYQELPAYGTVAYAILQVLQQSVEETESLDQIALRDYVTGNTFETVNGPIAYDENRIPAYTALLMQYAGDHNEVVWPPDRATAEISLPAS